MIHSSNIRIALSILAWLVSTGSDLWSQSVLVDSLEIYHSQKEWGKLVEYAEKVTLTDDLLWHHGVALMHLNKHQAADEILNIYLKSAIAKGDDASVANAYYLIATNFTEDRDHKNANAAYVMASRIGLDKIHAHLKMNIDFGLAANMLRLTEYAKADSIYRSLVTYSESVFGLDSYEYYRARRGRYYFYYKTSDYKRSRDILLSLERNLSDSLKMTSHYPQLYSDIGICSRRLHENDRAIDLYKRALYLLDSLNIDDHELYGNVNSNLSSVYIRVGEYDLSLKHVKKAQYHFKSKWGEDHPAFMSALVNETDLLKEMGVYDDVEKNYLRILTYRTNEYGEHWSHTGMALKDLAKYYIEIGNIEEAEGLLLRLSDILTNDIDNAYATLGEDSREAYYNSRVEHMISWLNIIGQQSSSDAFASMLYQSALKYKGFQLLTSQQSLRYAMTSTDEELKSTYDQYISLTQELKAEEFKKIKEKDPQKIQELRGLKETMERQLALASDHFRRTLDQAYPDVNELQTHLAVGDYAIEFHRYNGSAFNLTNQQDSFVYSASILGANGFVEHFDLFPEYIIEGYLEDNSVRREAYVDALYSNDPSRGFSKADDQISLYQLIWKPILSRLPGAKKIYFSPVGLLHRINMDAIIDDEGSALSDHLDLVSMISTSKIPEYHRAEEVNLVDAYVVGGVDFDQYQEVDKNLADEVLENKIENTFASVGRSYRNNSWPILKYSQNEAAQISVLMTDQGIRVRKLEGVQATEESFKLLGAEGNSPSIIHLATHGYFLADVADEMEELEDMGSRFEGTKNPMYRSGVLFAGANKGWLGDTLITDREDGILTAYEIANMNLSNTELVVLSACETGLGDLKGSEGVYGLQRAFKKAGVQNMILSLWQIDDGVTDLMMQVFYKNWLVEKMSIREAFQKMQHEFRVNRRMSTHQWAGLVLVE